jgi:hypothetical protein
LVLTQVTPSGTPAASGAALEETPHLASTSDAGVKGNDGGSFPDLAASGVAITFSSNSTNLDLGDRLPQRCHVKDR